MFHIHQTDFQVVAINGKRRRFTGYQDTVNLPAATRKNGRLVPGEVTVIIPFTNPLMVGQFVYHCHIVQHADQGMMANIQVVARMLPHCPGNANSARFSQRLQSRSDVDTVAGDVLSIDNDVA